MTGDLVQDHYQREGLTDDLQAIAARLTPAPIDGWPFDQLHSRGSDATAELARRAGLQPGWHVLDVGSGLGGSARYLAGRFHVRVTGIELVRDFVRLAAVLTNRAGLADRIVFRHGNALSAPFPTHAFECAWVQHVLMNVTDKARLFAELRRVLLPGGVLAVHEVVVRDARRLRYPLPWASSPLTHFPPSPARLRTAIESAGFALRSWRDTSRVAVRWWREAAQAIGHEPEIWQRLLGPSANEMVTNVVDNLERRRMGVVVAAFDKVP